MGHLADTAAPHVSGGTECSNVQEQDVDVHFLQQHASLAEQLQHYGDGHFLSSIVCRRGAVSCCIQTPGSLLWTLFSYVLINYSRFKTHFFIPSLKTFARHRRVLALLVWVVELVISSQLG